MKEVNLRDILNYHSILEDEGLCLRGIRDRNLVMSLIDGQYWYETYVEKIIFVAYSICGGHIFNDGNKRTSYYVLLQLEEIGYVLNYQGLAEVVLMLAGGQIKSRQEFQECVFSNLK